MRFTWRTELPALLVLVLMVALAIWAWSWAPERMPVHWGISGQPDRWGGRAEGVLVFPGIGLLLYLLMLVLPKLDPGRANYARFADAYFTVRLAVLGMIAGVQVVTLAVARGRLADVNPFLLPLLGVLFLVIGNLLGKLRPNWFIGIRTPWTLSSKRSWSKTHRAGGWVFVVCGVLFVAAGVVQRPWAQWTAMAALSAGVLGLVVLSYVVWRDDPDKVPPAGTAPANDGT
jgi:uncharacterized membrane protein